MDFTTIFCYYVLLPYFASIVFPPQEAITCHGGGTSVWIQKMITNKVPIFPFRLESSEEQLIDKSSTKTTKHLITRFFEQKCDHHHYHDGNTWKQRYLINDSHYDGKGKIFIKIGTDEDITAWNMQNGRWFEYCKEAKALCVGMELRGYGVSLPYGNLNDENLVLITSDQTLSDIAWFIYNFKDLKTGHILPDKLKWMVYGKSEQGTLAVWLRMKFPHLVDAALSLSAPVLAKEDYNDYFKLILNGPLEKIPNLKNEMQKAYTQIQNQLTSNFRDLLKLYKFCHVYSSSDGSYTGKNNEFMYFTFAHTVAIIMQYGDDKMAFMKKKLTNIMLNTKEKYNTFNTEIKRFAEVIKRMLKKFRKKCLQINYQVGINRYNVTTYRSYQELDYILSLVFGSRASLYQRCTQLGRFETVENFFGTISLSFYTEFCSSVFGKQFSREILEKGIRRTNSFYGGLDIIVSRVIFVYGSEDPYKELGIVDRNPPNTVVYLLKGAGTCTELDNYKFDEAKDDKRDAIYSKLLEWLNSSEKKEESENSSID